MPVCLYPSIESSRCPLLLRCCRFLYFSNWLRGDIVQYDISDPEAPRFVSRVWVGGVIHKDGGLKVRLTHALLTHTL